MRFYTILSLSILIPLSFIVSCSVEELNNGTHIENTVSLCSDTIDNDGNGFADCNDQDCLLFALCTQNSSDQAILLSSSKNTQTPSSANQSSFLPHSSETLSSTPSISSSHPSTQSHNSNIPSSSSTIELSSSETHDQRYPGANKCKICHAVQFQQWKESGHAYKMNKVIGDSIPILPFSSIENMIGHTVTNALSEVPDIEMTLNNTSYIIGGYGWKAQYIDSNGLILHGANAQYNIESGEFSAYHDGESHSPYACGSCHTTGWDPGTTNPNLPMMAGTMNYNAITCQRCHGDNTIGGVAHSVKTYRAVNPENPIDIQGATAEFEALGPTHIANNVCAACHIRGSVAKKVTVAGGLIKQHEQSQELLIGRGGTTHGCVTCHDPHSSVKYDSQAAGNGVTKDCSLCHTTVSVAPIYASHTCTSCHMPKIVRSATTSSDTYVAGVTSLGIPGGLVGDMRSHILSLTSQSNPTFLADDLDGSADAVSIPVEYSCMSCHGTGGVGPQTGAQAASYLITTPVH